MDFINEFGLSQFVHEPTRISDAGKGHILDLVISNTHDVISDINVLNPFCTSDHCIIQFQTYNCPITVFELCEDKYYYDFKNADYDMISRFLSAVDWMREFSFAFCVEDYWNIFVHWMYRATELYVPVKKISSVRKPGIKIYPKYIKRLFAKKLQLWKKWTVSRNTADKHKYDHCAAKCKNAVDAYNAERELNMIESRDLGKFYAFVNKKLSCNRDFPPLKSTGDRHIIDPSEKANLFNEYFASVFTVDDKKSPVCDLKVKENMQLCNVEFSPAKVYKALRSLKPKCSHGPDGLPSILLHNLAGILSEPLSCIFYF
jgi:hypothetical protein